jgi:hypothetical protein
MYCLLAKSKAVKTAVLEMPMVAVARRAVEVAAVLEPLRIM